MYRPVTRGAQSRTRAHIGPAARPVIGPVEYPRGSMLDPAYVRDNIEIVRAGLRNRGLDPDKALEDIATLQALRRRLIPEVEGLKREQNTAGDEVAKAKRRGLDTAPIQEANRARAQQIKQLGVKLDSIEHQLERQLLTL